jgi:hypothetical protein
VEGRAKVLAEPLYFSVKPPVFGEYSQLEIELEFDPGEQGVIEVAGLIDRATNSYFWRTMHFSPVEELILVPELMTEGEGYWYRSALFSIDFSQLSIREVIIPERVVNYRTERIISGSERYDFRKTLAQQNADYLYSAVMIDESEGVKFAKTTFITVYLIKERGMYKFLISLPQYLGGTEILAINARFIK